MLPHLEGKEPEFQSCPVVALETIEIHLMCKSLNFTLGQASVVTVTQLNSVCHSNTTTIAKIQHNYLQYFNGHVFAQNLVSQFGYTF